ncbi:MAG: hypothetical protein JWN95_3737 [Frankiales bacterium]|nr:hypothetical protein [Frankiales bacterium]
MNTASIAIAVVGLIFGLGGLIAGGLALRTLGRLRQSVALLSRGSSGRETILDVAEKHMAASEAVRKDILELQRDLADSQRDADARIAAERAEISHTVADISQTVATVLRRVALVRYDAFDDLAGRLSFSLALLDDQGNGVTLTAIASSSDTRVYAKSLSRGVGEHTLSPEEEQAVKAALAR